MTDVDASVDVNGVPGVIVEALDAMSGVRPWSDIVLSHDGVPVYAKRRPGVGMPLVFLHGYGDYGDCWAGLIARLPADLDVTLVDSLGHGHSGVPGTGCDAVGRRDAVLLMLREQIGPAALIGHSMGAATALAVAACQPELVSALILEDPPWWMDHIAEPAVNRLRISRDEPIVQWIAGLQTQTVADVTDACRRDHPNWDDIEFEHWARSKLRVDLAGVDLPYREIPQSITEQWSAVTCPALLITGNPAHSGIVTNAVAEEFLRQVPTAVRSHHDNVGHDIRRDDAAGVSRAIATFLSDVTKSIITTSV